MKYRRLTLDELKELENEFVRFLASNTITSDDWVSLKTTNPEKAETLIEMFSDIVFEKVIEKVAFLEHRNAKDLMLFECLADQIKLIGVKIVGTDSISFAENQTAEQMTALFQSAPNGSLKMYSAEKPYKNNNRSQELFKMMENGSLISDGQLYKTLLKMK